VGFVVLESPFKTCTITISATSRYLIEESENIRYGRACLRDCLLRGEGVFGSHLLYTLAGVLDDSIQAERELGIQAGFAIGQFATRRVFYVDRGITSGMSWGLQAAQGLGQTCEARRLGGAWDIGFLPDVPLEEILSHAPPTTR
jgi:hypothetical protein